MSLPENLAIVTAGGKVKVNGINYNSVMPAMSQLNDDEIAMVMGHEIAHALREHGRERAGKQAIAQGGAVVADVASQLLGFGGLGRTLASGGSQLAVLAYGREDETEGDLVGMDLAARAGFDPRSGVALWQKMGAANKGAPPQWLSTHPSGKNRIAEISKHLPEALPLFAKARGVTRAQLAPYKTNWDNIAPVN